MHGPRARERTSGSSASSTRSCRSASISPSASPRGSIKVGGYRPGADAPADRRGDALPRHRDTDRRVAPIFLTDILTWLAFFAISAVAIYSVYDLINGMVPGGLSRWLPLGPSA